MIKKLNLMSKVELYYRTRSPYHIIDTFVSNWDGIEEYPKDHKQILFTREHEDFVIWEDTDEWGESDIDLEETKRISYEEFIKIYKDYNFVELHDRREYLTNRFILEKNSVFPASTNNKGVETMKFKIYGVDYYENILTILDANIYFLENCINSLDGVKKEEKYYINNQQGIVILENKKDTLISKINKLIKKSIKLEKYLYKAKYSYYKYDKSIVDDYTYDKKELELKNIIKELGEKKLIIKNIIKKQIFNMKQGNIVVKVGNKFIYNVLSKIDLSEIKINHDNEFRDYLDRYKDISKKVFEINDIIKDTLKEYDTELIKFYNFFKELYKQARINKIIEPDNIIDFAITATKKEIDGGLKDPSQKSNIALYFVLHAFMELKIL